MGKAFRIFMLGVTLAGITALVGRRVGRGPAMQDDAGNPAPR